MRRFLSPLAILVMILPGAAFANITGNNVILNSGQGLSLETGTGSGIPDILFISPLIFFEGLAKGINVTAVTGGAVAGASQFATLTASPLGVSTYISRPEFSSRAITPQTPGTIVVYRTNSGNTGALLLNTVSTDSVNLSFVTFESGTNAGLNGPTISQVLNNYGLIPAGFSNSGIAPGSLFIIKGSALADPNAQAVLQSSTAAGGLPRTLNGASVSVTVGSTTVQPAFYYAIASQLALVLPSNTPVGFASVTVTYGGQTSAPFTFQVVQSALGIAAYYGTGSGLGHAQDLNYNYYTYADSIPPGATIRLIGSGLGADGNPSRDTMYVTPSANDAINALAHVYVGGIDSTIVYQGPEGYPGLDEIDVTIPQNAPAGCFVSIVGVTASGLPTNFLTLPIGTGNCSDPLLGVTGSTLSTLGSQATVNTGYVVVGYSSAPGSNGGIQNTTGAFADFQQYSGSSYSTGPASVSLGSCIVTEAFTPVFSTGTSTPTALNPGTITVSSPNTGVSPVQLTQTSPATQGIFSANLPSGFLTATGGTFSISATAGTAAPAVGAFTTQVAFPTPQLSWTNQAAADTVVRASGVTLTWSGGSPGTFVQISGTSSSVNATGTFFCLAPVAAGKFTVPSYVLATMPSANGPGETLSIANYTAPQQFTAAGLDYGSAVGYVSYTIQALYE